MRYLLYCVLSSQENQKSQTLTGVGGQPVFLVSNNGLSAAVSGTNGSDVTPDLSRLLAYQKVIGSFHLDHTVIPMRYGSVFNEKRHIIQLLEEHRKPYEALLKKLEGCAEMGIRILISDRGPATRNPQPATSGLAYLAARKSHYEWEEEFTEEMNMVIQRCRAAFAGLYIKYKTESYRFRNPQSKIHTLLSLYFLVPRSLLESFGRVFWQLSAKESAKPLLSGPWPAYNFIPGDRDV